MSNSIGLIILNADDRPFDTNGAHNNLYARKQQLTALEHIAVVRGEVWLALYAIDNQYFGLLTIGNCELDVRRELCTTKTYDTRLLNLLDYLRRLECALALKLRAAVYGIYPLVALALDNYHYTALALTVRVGIDRGYRTRNW